MCPKTTTRAFLGVRKNVPKNTRKKSKNAQNWIFSGIFDFSGYFRGLFVDTTAKKTLFETVLGFQAGLEGPETPVNGRSVAKHVCAPQKPTHAPGSLDERFDKSVSRIKKTIGIICRRCCLPPASSEPPPPPPRDSCR